MKDDPQMITARNAYIRSLGMVVSRHQTMTLDRLMLIRSDEARRLLLRMTVRRKGTMKNKNTARLPKGPKAKPVKTEKPNARVEAMMRIAGKR